MAKKYELTDEHRAQLKPWADKWIANAMSTKPMDEAERERMCDVVEGLYRAANLMPPPRHRIVFVPSPFVLRFAGGFAAAIWWMRRNVGKPATYDATRAATYDATRAATHDATHDATDAATHDATRAATYDATDRSRWFSYRGNMVKLAAILKVGELGLNCAYRAYRLWHGGNQWSGWAAFLSFFRHVAQLPIDYSKWEYAETLAEAGPRIMHADFCMISERPELLLVDDQNRPHCATGPFCRWRDGSALYSYHGVRIPMWIIEERDTLTAQMAIAEENAEVRRVMIELMGHEKFLETAKAKPVHKDSFGQLFRIDQPNDEPMMLVKVRNSTPEPDGSVKDYVLRVHPELRPMLDDGFGELQELTARNAIASTFGLRGEEYAPMVES